MSNVKAPLTAASDGIDQDQFLTILSREDALARFEAALFPRAVPSERRPLADALGCALAEDVVAPIDVPPFDRSNVDGFAVRSADLASAGEGCAGAADPERRGDRLRHRAGAAGAVGNGDADRDRRAGAARRRCHRDGRAHPAGGQPRDRNPPRRFARAIRVLCRLRHRARRGAAARRHHDRLARDRHAGGLRHCRAVGRAPAARRRSSRPATNWCSPARRCARPRSTTPTARSSPRRSRRTAARRISSAPFPTTRPRSKPRCAARSPTATCWCCPAARRRARATSPTASSRGSASPASSRMASR